MESNYDKRISRKAVIIIWITTCIIMFLRYKYVSFDEISKRVVELIEVKQFENQELIDLIINIAVYMAMVISFFSLLLYLFFAVYLDEHLYAILLRKVFVLNYIGPASLLAILCTLPSNVWSLTFFISSPKDNKYYLIFLCVAFLGVNGLYLRIMDIKRQSKATVIAFVIVMTFMTGLSLLL